MLQPRDMNTRRRKNRLLYVAHYWAILTFAIIVGSNQQCSAQLSENEFIPVQPTKALRSDKSDVTTVLLVDNNNRSSHGRFLNVKPAVGLLTSTARTFIQEGVTTEYATKVLGTTLDNGRLYAQLLTKSSRVLYDHENSPPSKSYYSQQNDIVPDNDDSADWSLNNNYFDRPVTFIKNTDYISPNQPNNAFLVYPTVKQSHSFEDNGAVDYSREEGKDIVVADHIKAEALVDQRRSETVKESFSVSRSSSQSNNENEIKNQIKVDKVQPANNLPTYTIKNEFAPSGFSWDDSDYDIQTEKQFLTTADKRNGKMLYRGGIAKEDVKNLPSVTYYGFADFTTIVGDTVIVFSPQTAAAVNVGQITSIKGDATLHNDPTVVVSTVKTFLSQEPGMVTQTVKGHSINMETTLPTMVIEPVTPYRKSKGEYDDEDQDDTTQSLKEMSSTERNEVTTLSEEIPEEITEKEIVEAVQRVHTISPNLIQPSEISSSSIMLSKPSNEDIAKVLASLASVKAAHEHQATEPLETHILPSETKVSGGVTTIFFEDDPFDQLFQTAESIESSIKPTPSSIVPDVLIKSVESSTENIVELTTAESDVTTESIDETTILNQSESVSDDEAATTVSTDNESVSEPKQILAAEVDIPTCVDDSVITSSTHLKTLTYLTTFFIPMEDTTTTSIDAREVVSTEVEYACIAPSTVVNEPIVTTAVIDAPEAKKEPTTVPINEVIEKDEETTEAVMQFSTEASVTEATSKASNVDEKKPVSDESDEGDEIELIYKTLYTTYTYLTTFFHESTSSISSRKEVVTNIVTSTLDMGQLHSDDALSNLVAQMGGKEGIQPTSVGIGRPTTLFNPAENNLQGIDDIFLEESRDVQPTPALDTQNLNLNDIKTYYTTYTYFTTIFVDGETEISSRTEVYTNYVGNTIKPTAMSDVVTDHPATILFDDNEDVENSILEHSSPVKTYDNTIRRTPTGQQIKTEDSTETSTESEDDENNAIQPSYSTMIRSGDASSVDDNTETPITMVTDVKSSSSDGDRQIIENVNRQWNGLLEDQISSESNTDEIVPSPTLLLQTSYTTFTYFTTMYIGKSNSNILSRLETVTNVVTETLQPSRAIQIEEASLPITYFTTFTYWTTLYKDGSVTTTSREETVSNVVTPNTVVIEPTSAIEPTSVIETFQSTTIPVVDASIANDVNDEDAPPALVTAKDPVTVQQSGMTEPAITPSEPSTYYTTYTYFTTLYVGDDTVLNSRFETVTNVVQPSVVPTGRAINLGNSNNIVAGDEKPEKTKLFAPAYVPVSSDEPIKPTEASVVNSEPTGIISLNQGKIIDAEGISTIFYTTKAVGSNINGLYAQVIESTSSIKVDEIKKAAQTVSTPDAPGSRVHKTGLVRLIEGTIVSNRTTTLYESKVIGTIIDGRYAQIIESTSSFLIEKTIEPTGSLPSSIQPTATSKIPVKSTNIVSPTASAVESSIGDQGDEETTEEGYEDDEEGEEDDEEDDGTGRKKSRLTFSSRKRTFTPVIRPFASRNRPTFNPKRKNLSPSSATIVTRNDFTPTITATPASKSESSRGRFTSNKRQSSSISVPNSSVASSSSSRRFSRPSRTSAAPGSTFPSSTLPRSRSSASSRIQPSSTSLSGSSTRRPNIFRASSAIARPSILPSNSRFRINPTQSSSFNRGGISSSINATPRPEAEESDEDNLTTNVTNFPTDTTGDDDVQTTTENTRRNQNPLLRFRRPLSSGRAQSLPTGGTTSRPATITTRRSPLLGRGRTTSTTPTTTTTPKPKPRSFNRPAFTPQTPGSLPGRRAGSNLFPPRRPLLRPSNINQDLEKDDEISTDNQVNDDGSDSTDLTNDGDIGKTDNEDIVDDANTRDTRENKKFTVGFRKRVKRQVDYGSRTNSYSSRYRRPTPTPSSRNSNDDSEEQDVQTTRPKVTTISRFTPNERTSRLQNGNTNGNSVNKNAQANSRIRPTPSSTQSGRAQFTLREKDNLAPNSRSNFRRGNNGFSSSNRRKTSTTIPSRPKSPRLRNYSGIVTESPYNSRNTNSRSRSNARGRPTSRSRSRSGQDTLDYAIQPSFDGTITVTHHVPTEITIPVVNGKVTEYKNILTAKVSTEILGPKQYSTSIGQNGKNVIVLNNEITGIGNHGATEITQFVLHETPTTSVIFTPTTIRGRKTSFSHAIPSTVYNVEQVISTIQPQIAANAPLANILLSQLLLGNLGLPQQQQINPLLGVQPQQMIQQGPAVPQTEFKVRTTTYVTTVTNAMSTVIPLTFRGKEILTTIVDNSVDVITATEFLTDTIVSTPTVIAQQPQQINSLLFQQLLQQQAQQQQPQQLLQPLTNDAITPNLFQDAAKVDNDDSTQSNKLYSSDVDDFRDNGREYDDYPEQDQFDNVPTINKVMVQRKSNRKYNNNRAQISQSPLETSVITLYVSGRRPGEFSTVLSTIISSPDSSLQKRAVAAYEEVKPSVSINDIDPYESEGSDIEQYLVLPGTDLKIESSVDDNRAETESLESIIGDVSKYINRNGDVSKMGLTTTVQLQQQPLKSTSFLV